MSESGYNGWTNRETWNIALHLHNDPGSQAAAFEAVDPDSLARTEDNLRELVEMIMVRFDGDSYSIPYRLRDLVAEVAA